jgi:hypothetical protein
MNDPQTLLSQLRDIHMPEPVSWWPPAPGWWLLAGLLVLAGLLWWTLARRRRPAHIKSALRELDALQATFQADGNHQRLITDVSRLLRRAALAHFPRQQVAGLTGQQWLEFLDRSGHTSAFASGPGKALASAPYDPRAQWDAPALLGAARTWLTRLAREKAVS